MAVYILDTLEQARIQSHIIGMLCQDGLHLLCQSIHLVIGLSRQQVEEHRADAVQQVVVALAFLLLVYDRVIECRLGGVVDGLFYLLVITTDALHEGLLIVFQANTVKRHRVVRCLVVFKKRVYPFLYTIIHKTYTFGMQKYEIISNSYLFIDTN